MPSYRGLALETSGHAGSIAAFEQSRLLAQRTLGETQRSAQSLAPALEQLLAELSWQPEDVNIVAVANGPGSFTGLRIGVTTAKVFAYAARADIVAVDTLAAIAANLPDHVPHAQIVLDAQRGDLYAAAFRRPAPHEPLTQLEPSQIQSTDTWLASLQPGTTVAGPILERLIDRLPKEVVLADQSQWAPQAAGVAQVAWQRFAQGQRDDLWSLVPRYLRRSAAEEKLLAKSKLPDTSPT